MNHRKGRQDRQAKVDCTHLNQKVRYQTMVAHTTPWGMDERLPAYRWLLKYSQLFMVRNLVSPLHPQYLGRNLVRGDNDAAGKGDGKKRKASCNDLHRGYALTRKGADLPTVFHCRNRGKLKNVR